MERDLYFVHAVDTEGPIKESLPDIFTRLDELFDLQLEPSLENLLNIQNGRVDANGREDEIADCFSPKRLGFIESMSELNEMLDTVFSRQFRMRFSDSFGEPYRFTFFCLDHVGFTENPRQRLLGYNAIVKHYKERIDSGPKDIRGIDEIEWHFHGVPFSREAHRFGLNWTFDNAHIQVLTRRLIEFNMFPTSFRAGGWIERADMNVFLEQWIPFDYSSNALRHENLSKQPDYQSRFFSDWTRAPQTWCGYNPSFNDYQTPGELKRRIFRSLSIDARIGSIDKEDIRFAFNDAQKGKKPILSVTNHDNRNIIPEVENVWQLVCEVAKEFPEVNIRHTSATRAAQLQIDNAPVDNFKIDVSLENNKLIVNSDFELFGPQPFLSFKTYCNHYFHDNFARVSAREWVYYFTESTIPIKALSKIAIAAHDTCGRQARWNKVF